MAFFNWFKKNKKEDIKEDIKEDEKLEQIDEILEDIEEEYKEETILEEIEKNIDENELKKIEKEIEEELIQEELVFDLEENLEKLEEEVEVLKDILEDKLIEVELEEEKQEEKNLEELEQVLEELEQEESEEAILEKIEKNLEEEEIKEIENEIEEEVEEKIEDKPKKSTFFSKIKEGLSKTRNSILNGVEQVLSSFTKIDEELFEELEEALIMSDIGVETSTYIIDKVKDIVKQERIKDVEEVKGVIIKVITEILEEETEEFELKNPSVILVIGVNGVGKTTTIGKLANNYKKEGRKVILAAGDTFRAAAIDQLQVWGERTGIDVIRHQEGSDPAAVVFDAIKAGKARGADLLICDTAGRLHNKKNLMEELKKIARIVNRENPDAQVETLLVLDATTGQNALQQAKLFSEVADITGIVLTKLDGTAKGGVVIAIKNEMKIPVRFIGVGEGIEDLRPFDAKEFSKALFE